MPSWARMPRRRSRIVYGFRGRMDERYDLVRSVTDGRYVYVRNYMPHKIYGQHVDYMFQTPTTQRLARLHDEGKLTAAQDVFWNTKPPEELYDLASDPDEVAQPGRLAPSTRRLSRSLRRPQRDWVRRIRDVGFLPEGEIHSRSRRRHAVRHGTRRRGLSLRANLCRRRSSPRACGPRTCR